MTVSATLLLVMFIALLVGLILAARISSGQPTAGEGYEMDAISSTSIGGTSMSGCNGSLTGTIQGDVIIGHSFYQQIVKGCLIILAVLLDMLSKGKKN